MTIINLVLVTRVQRPTQYIIYHFRDDLPSQSLAWYWQYRTELLSRTILTISPVRDGQSTPRETQNLFAKGGTA